MGMTNSREYKGYVITKLEAGVYGIFHNGIFCNFRKTLRECWAYCDRYPV